MIENLLIFIGPTRTGTTDLWHRLNAGLKIRKPRIKEHYLFDNLQPSIDQYQNLFSGPDPILHIDFAPTIFHNLDATTHARNLNADTTFVVTVRAPRELIQSGLLYNIANGSLIAEQVSDTLVRGYAEYFSYEKLLRSADFKSHPSSYYFVFFDELMKKPDQVLDYILEHAFSREYVSIQCERYFNRQEFGRKNHSNYFVPGASWIKKMPKLKKIYGAEIVWRVWRSICQRYVRPSSRTTTNYFSILDNLVTPSAYDIFEKAKNLGANVVSLDLMDRR